MQYYLFSIVIAGRCGCYRIAERVVGDLQQRNSCAQRLFVRLGRVGDVSQFVQVEPVLRFAAIEVIIPVADPELLVESGVIGTHVGDTTSIFIAHVEKLAVKFLVRVEAHGPVGAVEGEGDIWELLPAFHSFQRRH